jgi:outer membrane protein TolC
MSFRSSLVLAGLPLLASAAWAQPPLTLDAAIGEARAANQGLSATRAAGDEAQERIPQVRAGYFPRIDFTEGWQRSDQPVFVFSSLLSQQRFSADNFAIDALNHPDPLSNYRVALTIEQTIYDGGRREAAIRRARLDDTMAQLDIERAELDVRLAVVRAFGSALAARAAHEAASAAVTTVEEDLRRAESRRDAGLETEANVLALRVRLAERTAGRIRAASEERVARAALNVVIGAPVDDARVLIEPAAVSAEAEPARIETLALEHRPELKHAAARRESALAARSMARSGFLPQVVAQGGVEANGDSFSDRASSWLAGIQVRINLFAGGADAARVRESAAAVARVTAERAQLEANIRLQVRSAIAEHESAIAREATARQATDQARESHRMIRDRYEAGLVPASELLRAAEAVLEAESLRIAALTDTYVSAAAVTRAAGTEWIQP